MGSDLLEPRGGEKEGGGDNRDEHSRENPISSFLPFPLPSLLSFTKCLVSYFSFSLEELEEEEKDSQERKSRGAELVHSRVQEL